MFKSFSEGLASVTRTDKKNGDIDRAGNIVIEAKRNGAYNFSGGLALVERGGKRGFTDRSGKAVIEPNYEWAWYEKSEDRKTYLFVVRLRPGENVKDGKADAAWLDSTGKEIWHSPQ